MKDYIIEYLTHGKPRKVREHEDYAEVELTRGYWMKIDFVDLPLVHWKPWSALGHDGAVYAVSGALYFHKLICPRGAKGDHVNCDQLDNRRANLRPATHSQNQYNQRLRINSKTGYKGAQFNQRAGKFNSVIHFGGKAHWLGTFDTARDAAMAYDRESVKYFGEFARTNASLGLL